MKKRQLIFAFLCLAGKTWAQNIGIGTNTPNSSAILHLNSNNKGVLFPSISLQAANDNTTIPNAAAALVVYNSNVLMPGGKGLYVNAGTQGSPSWQPVGQAGQLLLPYTGSTATEQYAFQVNNTTANTNAVGILGYCPSGKGLYGSSNTGTGIYASSNSGLALEVNGKIKISGLSQTPGVGKVLTSDASGNATWKGGVAFGSWGIQPDGAAAFSSNTEKKVAFYTEDFDYGNVYIPSTASPYSTFTAPYSGLYHFDAAIRWKDVSNSNPCALHLKTFKNGTETTRATASSFYTDSDIPLECHVTIAMEAGEQAYFTAFQATGSTISLFNYNDVGGKLSCYFSGFAVLTY